MKVFMLELKSCCVLSVVHSVQVKIMFLLLIWMMIVSFQTGSSEDVLTPFKDVLMSLEGESVTLSCNYSGSANNLYWYQQKSSSSPQFLIQEYSETTGRLSLQHDKQSKEFHLNISSAAVSDSAVYYCALNGAGGKMIFGKGTTLLVQSKDEFEPYYYKLQDDETTVCLATGFSRHNATSNHTDYSEEFKKTEAGRISSPDPALYNQVIFPTDNGEQCEASGTESGPCEDTLTPDPMVNGVSFTILVLRVIFLKTVVFDILMTMRLWISQ